MNKAEEFRNTFNELERLIETKYSREYGEYRRKNRENPNGKPASAVRYIADHNKELSKDKVALHYCCDVRNVLSHNPTINEKYIVEPGDEALELLKEVLYKLKNPVRAVDVMIPREDMFFCGLEDHIMNTMRTMKNKLFTHVPILENGVVIGAFSENTLLSWMVSGENVLVDNETRFSELYDYLPIDKHDSESFKFISIGTPLLKINEMFENSLKNNERIGLCFVTGDGKSTSKLLGIITAWDIAGNM